MTGQNHQHSGNVERNSAVETRRFQRRDVRLDAQITLSSGDTASGYVENISAGGALLRTKAKVQDGDELTIRIARIGHFTAVVCRNDKLDVAIEFKIRRERAARLADRLICVTNDSDDSEKPSFTLTNISAFNSTLTFEDASHVECEVLEFSTTGATIRVSPAPDLHEHVSLGKTPARVQRIDENGIAYLEFYSKHHTES